MVERHHHYDSSKSVVVFLGPSLTRARAAELLDANYAPPAQMGDIYRFIASGVSLIVLIDGYFHSVAAIWQREILAAMDAGVRVIGAASMGALRAAELHPEGVIGVGKIFELFRDGIIEGDDEVAIAHAEAGEGYRTLSDPLVNIRHNLQRAVEASLINSRQMKALIGHAKRTFYPHRSYTRLLEREAELPPPLVKALVAKAIDLKSADAELALLRARQLLASGELLRERARPTTPSRYYGAASKRERGFLLRDGRLVTGKAIWDALLEDRERARELLLGAAKTFYLGRQARRWAPRPPDDYCQEFGEAWDRGLGVERDRAWLSANGLAPGDYRRLIDERAGTAWALERVSELGLDTGVAEARAVVWRAVGASPSMSASELWLLTNWLRERGLNCPMEYREQARDALEAARGTVKIDHEQWQRLVDDLVTIGWVLRKQPHLLGYISWSPMAAILEELQITGQAARIAMELV